MLKLVNMNMFPQPWKVAPCVAVMNLGLIKFVGINIVRCVFSGDYKKN